MPERRRFRPDSRSFAWTRPVVRAQVAVFRGARQMAAIEVVASEVLVSNAVANDEKNNFELLVSRGDAGLLRTALGRDAPVEGAQISVLGVGSRQRRLRRAALTTDTGTYPSTDNPAAGLPLREIR